MFSDSFSRHDEFTHHIVPAPRTHESQVSWRIIWIDQMTSANATRRRVVCRCELLSLLTVLHSFARSTGPVTVQRMVLAVVLEWDDEVRSFEVGDGKEKLGKLTSYAQTKPNLVHHSDLQSLLGTHLVYPSSVITSTYLHPG